MREIKSSREVTMPDLKVEKLGNIYILKINGELDIRHADELKSLVMKLLVRKEASLWKNRN